MEGAGDQRWNEATRRNLRKELRNELLETHQHRDEITIPKELDEKLRKGNSLYSKVVSSREAVIDSEHFRLLSEIAFEQTQATRGELIKFDPVKYREKLITLMGGRSTDRSCEENLDWYVFGEKAIKAYRLAPCVEFCYGTLEMTPVRQIVRRATAQAKRTVNAEKPKQIQELGNEEESTTKDVKHILHFLKEACSSGGSMEYHKFIIDPDSFSRTVENIFHFSFLVKEGRAGIKKGHDGNPVVYIPENLDGAGQTTRIHNRQAIVSIDMQKWKEWIETYRITESYIPERET